MFTHQLLEQDNGDICKGFAHPAEGAEKLRTEIYSLLKELKNVLATLGRE